MKLFSVFFLFILLLSHNVIWGQDNLEDQEDKSLQKELKDQRSQYQAILKTVGGEGIENDPDFQKMVQEGLKDPQKLLKKLQDIQQKNGKSNANGMMGSLENSKNMKVADLLKGNASKIMKSMIQQFNPISPQQLKTSLLVTTEGKPQGDFLKNNPKFLNFLVRALKHPNALPNVAKILDQRQKLMYFVGANIFVLFFGIWYKRVQRNRNQDREITKSVNQFIFRFIFLSGIRLGIFVAFFHSEVGDIFGVFKKSFFA